MYKISRVMLILAVLATFYSVAMLAGQISVLMYVIVGVALIAAGRRGYRSLTAFGTARWASADDLEAAGMMDAKTGPIIGRVNDWGKQPLSKALRRLFDPRVPSKEACGEFLKAIQTGRRRTLNPALVRLVHAVHTVFFAPTGVGKGRSCVIPFLKICNESAVVPDFKGDLYHITGEHRRKVFGHRTVVLDLRKALTQQSDTYNAMDSIHKDSPTALDECRDMAEAIVTRSGEEKDPHWVDSAEAWIAALIALVVQYGEPNDRSLQTVRTLLSNPQKLDMAIKLMCASDAWDGMLARMGNQLTNFKDKELASTLTTTNRFLSFLDTPAVAAITKTSSFDPGDLLKGKMTVYLVLPPEHMRAQAPLLRLWIGSLLRAAIRGGLQEKNKVHFVLDEAGSLGHMNALDDAVDKYRGYGVRLQFFYQAIGQLKSCWPKDQGQTLLSNTAQVYFGVNDLDTATLVSNRLGEQTIVVDSGGTGTGTSYQSSPNGQGSTTTSSNRSNNWSQQGRKLLKPEEVMALPHRTAITFTPGVPPICTTLVRYDEEPDLGRGPGWWGRFKAAVQVSGLSLLLLAAAAMVAKAVSMGP